MDSHKTEHMKIASEIVEQTTASCLKAIRASTETSKLINELQSINFGNLQNGMIQLSVGDSVSEYHRISVHTITHTLLLEVLARLTRLEQQANK